MSVPTLALLAVPAGADLQALAVLGAEARIALLPSAASFRRTSCVAAHLLPCPQLRQLLHTRRPTLLVGLLLLAPLNAAGRVDLRLDRGAGLPANEATLPSRLAPAGQPWGPLPCHRLVTHLLVLQVRIRDTLGPPVGWTMRCQTEGQRRSMAFS